MTDSVTPLAELIADAIAGKLPQPPSKAAIAQITALRQLLMHKFQQDSATANTLTAIDQSSRQNLDLLIEQLKLAIQQDAQFAVQMQTIVQIIYPEKFQTMGGMVMIASGKAQAFQTKVEGGTANIGNNYIIQPRPLPSPVGIPENLPRSGIEPEKFVGRADELKWLHDRLQRENCIAISAIAGMGGVGKTELALQYAIAHQNAYPGGICWLEAKQNIGDQIVDFAEANLGINPPIPVKSAAPLNETNDETNDQKRDREKQDKNNLIKIVRWCWQRWNPEQVLIIFNDVADYTHIQPYLPPADSRFRVLITTRQRLLKDSERLELKVLCPDAALSLLELLAGEACVQAEISTARDICQWLGYLPLGLELVGRYLARKANLSLAEMLKRLKVRGLEQPALQKPKSEADMTAQLGMTAAFELSWQELSPIAQAVGCFLSIFDVVLLPWSLVEQCYSSTHDPDGLETARDDELLEYHLIQREDQETYKLHELIREFFQSKLIELEQTDNLWQAVTLKVAAIAKHNPLLVAEIVHKKWLDWQWVADIAQLSALDWGWQVKTASQAWIEGLGSLSDITFSLRDDGTLPTLGVSLVQKDLDQPWGPLSYVQTSWNFSSPSAKPVVDLPPESQHLFGDNDAADSSAWIALSDAGWNHFQSASLSPQASWAWRRTFENIGSALTARLRDRSFPVPEGYLSLEAAWYAAAHRLNYDPFSTTPIPLDALVEPLSWAKSGMSPRVQHCYKQLQIEIEAARHRGETHLYFPHSVQRFRWGDWSPEVLLAYATDIHQGAVAGYEQIVTTWLTRLSPKLPLASIFPAQLVGLVVPPKPGLDEISLIQFWQPLPINQPSGVNFRLGDHPISAGDFRWQGTPEQFRALRPQTSMYPSTTHHTMSPLSAGWLGVCPVTELVYQWLWNDLHKAGWVKAEKLENAGHPYWR